MASAVVRIVLEVARQPGLARQPEGAEQVAGPPVAAKHQPGSEHKDLLRTEQPAGLPAAVIEQHSELSA